MAGTPEALAIADLNHDGIPDAVVATGNGTQVLMGAAGGNFRPAVTVDRNFATALAIADFNNDGNPDIVAAIVTNGSQLAIALGNGDGTFQAAQVLPNGCLDCFVAAADFNGDGNIDLAVASTSEVQVLLGQGNGTFSSNTPVYFTQFSIAVTAGDINQDGKPDLAVTDFGAGTEIVLMGNGDGSFTRRDYTIASTPFQAVLADLNGDGMPDLAVADRNTGSAFVMLNQGGGAFGPSTKYLAGCSPFQSCTFQNLAAGDFNHDGRIDLASPGAILPGNGDGSFQPPQHFHSGAFPSTVASADFNRDRFSDLLIGNSTATNVSVLFGTPAGMSRPLGFRPGNQPRDLAVSDLNGDGTPDLAVAAASDNAVNIFLGRGNGFFIQGASLAVQQPGAVAVADVNRDGKPDLVVSSDFGTTIFLGSGDGTFHPATQYPSFFGDCTFNAFQNTAAPCLVSADFNGDGKPDLVGALWIQDTVSFMLGNGDGTYRPGPQTLTLADVPQGIAVADFNHDGKLDIAVSGAFGSVTVFPGNGDGTFGAGTTLKTGTSIAAGITAGDVDGDGNPDIVLAGGSGSSIVSLAVFLLKGNGDMTFKSPEPLTADQAPNGVILGDFNGDGLMDIASANVLGDSVTVLINQGHGHFAPESLYGAGAGPVVVRSGDLNHDGNQDLVVINQVSSDLNILLHAPK